MIPLRDNVSTKTKPIITWLLVLVNCFVFYRELHCSGPASLERFIFHWAVVPSRFWAHPASQWTTLITAEFLHGGWAHIIGNMLFLIVFGPSVEDRMGHLRYLFFYLAIGMFANGAQAYTAAGASLPLLGASGAIAGVLGSYFFYYPYARILTLIPFFIFSKIIELPAYLFLGLWFVMQAFEATHGLAFGVRTAQGSGGIAWLAHASGFIAGLIVAPALSNKKPGRSKGSKD